MTNDIRNLIADDGFAMSFQSMGQYRTALLSEIDNTTSQTNPIDEKELIDLVSSLWVTANSLDHFGQCHEVSPGLLRRASEFISKQDARISELAGALASPEAVTQPPNALPSRILTMCKKRGWSLHWTSRGAYLHLEASELIEAIRGKHGDPLSEAADVLLVLMSITENAGIPWCDVLNQTAMTCARLEVCDPYPGEERGALAQPAPAPAVVPVSERPWDQEGWCDERGYCWRFDPCPDGWWSYGRPTNFTGDHEECWTHMAPHNAIPLPQAEEVEA
jgi:hypothetical protein